MTDLKLPATGGDLFDTGPVTAEIGNMTFTMSNNLLPARPRPLTTPEEIAVTGEFTAYFDAPQLLLWWRAAAAARENWMLRIARPHMGRRQFRRWRGEVRANRRKNWKRP